MVIRYSLSAGAWVVVDEATGVVLARHWTLLHARRKYPNARIESF